MQTVDQFFALKVPMRSTEMNSLFRGIDNAFQMYANHVIDNLGEYVCENTFLNECSFSKESRQHVLHSNSTVSKGGALFFFFKPPPSLPPLNPVSVS